MARPKIEIKWDLVNELCKIFCTGPEIAQVLGVSEDTMTRAAKRDHDKSFADYIKEQSAGGKVSLRRFQFKAAENGNPTMLIWLGKQFLEQQDVNHVVSSEAPIIQDDV